jgi:hypothetical protein
MFARRHLPHRDINAQRMAQLGRPVKMMLGGLTGWADEGLAFAESATTNMK